MRFVFFIAAMVTASLPIQNWEKEANQKIENIRKGNFSVTLFTSDNNLAAETPCKIEQTRHYFKFGTFITSELIGKQTEDSKKYEKFILDHFNAVVCEKEMTWLFMEEEPYEFNFAPLDQLLSFATRHDLSIRGRCLFQAGEKYVPPWVQFIPKQKKKRAVMRRLQTVIPRYKGFFFCWDVNNDMLDGSYYNDHCGPLTRIYLFKKAQGLHPDAPLFVNEYNVIGNEAKFEQYLRLIDDLKKRRAPIGGIGIQEHMAERFSPNEIKEKASFDPQKIRGRLDQLAARGHPVHFTQLSFKTTDEAQKARALENCFRIAFSHPAVEAIVLRDFFEKTHWMGRDAALIDAQWNVLPAGKILQHLLKREWATQLDAKTNSVGKLEFRGFFGDYKITTTTPDGKEWSAKARLTPDSKEVAAFFQPVQPVSEPIEEKTKLETPLLQALPDDANPIDPRIRLWEMSNP